MGVDEWREMIVDLGFLDECFTQREVTLCFVWARLRSHDEQSEKGWRKTTNLSFEDFLEAFVRVATMKSLPTDEMIEAAGAADAGEFLLSMQDDDPAEHHAFVAANQRQWDDGVNGKLGQPVARCVDHLCMLMVRTVKSTSGMPESAQKLAITRKESVAFDLVRGG